MEHKILFDGYETTFIEMFLELHKKMYERWYEPLTQFAIRTIHEMGFKRTQILFNKKLNPKILISKQKNAGAIGAALLFR